MLTVLDAFCGAGGLSLGFEMAGWDTALAFDNDPIAVDTFNMNHSGPSCCPGCCRNDRTRPSPPERARDG